MSFVAGQRQEVSIRLARPITQIKIDSVPRGASVRVRGRAAGTTPVSMKIEAFETSSILISKPGYRSVKRTIRPGRDAERDVPQDPVLVRAAVAEEDVVELDAAAGGRIRRRRRRHAVPHAGLGVEELEDPLRARYRCPGCFRRRSRRRGH